MKCFFCGYDNLEQVKFCGECGHSLTGGSVTVSSKDSDMDMLNQYLSPKFILERKIGKGGMASVYLGEQTALQRKVVVKILNEDISNDAEIRERFLLEARTPARLKHLNIVEVIDVGICNDRPYYIMEYAPGGSLADKLKEYRDKQVQFPFREAIEIITKILDALNYCHENNLQSHRDIKPANIMFRYTGEPIIVDFGIAKISDSSITRTRMTMGTANYMSPEQCQGRKDIDGRSDVYSVGIMLFELLAGELPFKGDSGLSIMIKQVKEKLPSLSQRIKGRFERTDPDYTKTADKIEKIIDKACAKSRKKRFQTASEFAMELGDLIGSKLNLTSISHHTIQNTWGLVFAFLFLGLGIGGFLGYKVILENPAVNIILDTTPPGAKITDLNSNVYEGTTPYSTAKKEVGPYKYKLSLDGYKDETVDIYLKDTKIIEQRNVFLVKNTIPEINPTDEKNTIDQSIENSENSNNEQEIEEKNIHIKNGFIYAGGLVWQSSDIKRMNWYSAKTHCRNIGMRLPTKQELKYAYDSKSKKLFSKPCCEYWSSVEYEADNDNAYNINMKNYESFFSPKSNIFFVRCVAK
jgi:serine/threonine protein kinase